MTGNSSQLERSPKIAVPTQTKMLLALIASFSYKVER